MSGRSADATSDHRFPPSDVDRLLGQMTLREKIGQMTQVEFGSITPDQVGEWAIGSVLSGGGGNHGDGSAADWRAGVDAYVEGSLQSRLGIPIVYGTDAVHGHNNVLGATIFPHHIGLGATRDPHLVEAIARASALETAATGARWSFAPCLAVPQDPRWGRTYEGFSEDPSVVSELGAAAVRGWQGTDLPASGVLACAKHFVGEGAMEWGSAGRARHPWIDWWDGWGEEWQIDQGNISLDEAALRSTHLPPFAAAVAAGVATVMACYATWRHVPLHAHHQLLTNVLKGELGFDGFVVSDWMAVNQIDADFEVAVERSINAGVDMVMVPFDFRGFIETVERLVVEGRISVQRVDDAVRRILHAKDRLGLLSGQGDEVPLDVVGCAAHRALARRAVVASAVVLKDDGALPIRPGEDVVAAGVALDDIGLSCGGWTISWDGGVGPITDGRTILDGLRTALGASIPHTADGSGSVRATVGVVAVHEFPYVEGGGDRANLNLPDDQVEVFRRVRARVDRLIVVVVSGRPVVLAPILEDADAIVAAWLPGSEADGVGDVLTGLAEVGGRLPVRWQHTMEQVRDNHTTELPEPWPVGHGRTITHRRTKETS